NQPARVRGGGAFLIVVEIDEDRPPLAPPRRDCARPFAQRPIRIVVLVAAAGPMPAHVDITRGHLPGRGRVVMVGQTKRYVMLVQEIEDIVVVPALVTELEGEAITARQQIEEGRQPLGVL